MLSSDFGCAWHALIFARVTRALRAESCWLAVIMTVCASLYLSGCMSATPNGRRGKRGRDGRKRRKEEEKEGEVNMTNTAWCQQQPDHLVSIEETKLKKRGFLN